MDFSDFELPPPPPADIDAGPLPPPGVTPTQAPAGSGVVGGFAPYADPVGDAEGALREARADLAAAVEAGDKLRARACRLHVKNAEDDLKAAKRRAREVKARAAVEKRARPAQPAAQPLPAPAGRVDTPFCFQDPLPLVDNKELVAAFWRGVAAAPAGASLREARHSGTAALVAAMNRGFIMLTRVARPCILTVKPNEVDPGAVEPVEQAISVATQRALGPADRAPADVAGRFPESFVEQLERVQLMNAWMDSEERRTAYCRGFFPPSLAAPAKVYNSYHGPGIAPDAGGNPHGAAAVEFQHHVRARICGGDAALFAAVMSWCASLVQRPGEKVRWALVLRGAKGAGKGTLYNVLEAIVGRRYCRHPSGPAQIIGRFNSCIESSLLVFLDELVWAGDKEAEGVLQKLVTEQIQAVERKGVDSYTCRNLAHVLIASNADWVVPTTAGERRYTVCDVSDELHRDKPRGEAVHAVMINGVRDIAALLYGWRIDPALLNACHTTAGIEDQHAASLQGVARWLADKLGVRDGRVFELRHKKADLFDLFKREAGTRFASSAPFFKELKRLLDGEGYTEGKLGQGGRDGAYVQLPAYDVCLGRFRERLAMPRFLAGDSAGDGPEETPLLDEVYPPSPTASLCASRASDEDVEELLEMFAAPAPRPPPPSNATGCVSRSFADLLATP